VISLSRATTTFACKAALLCTGLVVLTIAGVRLTDRADSRREVRSALDDGGRFADSLVTSARALPTARISFPAALAIGYLARAELGLGSPFRLVDLARTDPRLPVAWRPRVAHGILARLARDSASMRPDREALNVALVVDSGAGRALLQLVDSVMEFEGDSPLALNAVRIAAAQASAGGIVRQGVVPLLDAAALLAFDRVRARRDLQRAIMAASRRDGDLLQLVALWRAERRLSVERPLLAEPAPSSRRIATRVPMLLAAITAAARTRDSVAIPGSVAAMPQNAARALSMLVSIRQRPPQPQVRLAVLDARVVAVERQVALSPPITRMLEGATNEETLVITLANAAGDSVQAPMVAAATLLAAQGMRTLAQEAAFHPGTVALRPEQVVARLGLASLTFGKDVPAAWQPFYAREFAAAVDAVSEVFPRASFPGLHVHIGDTVLSGALAMHDPRTRTLTLPLATGFGAVGHELMHDLDWQAARTYANRRGTYATDNAVRVSRTQPIAANLARLAEFVPASIVSNAYNTEARRPAELLARGADWFLASALARHGRVNGALSAVQDSWIRGYASASGPAAFGDHAAALAALFDAMPTLAVRAAVSPRTDAEREPDLGTIARAVWFAPLPSAAILNLPQSRSMIPASRGKSCSPLARLRLAPMLGTAREVARGFIEPRIERGMYRWARAADTAQLSADASLLRLALLGAPMNPAVIDSARSAWTLAAWRSLPCLAA